MFAFLKSLMARFRRARPVAAPTAGAPPARSEEVPEQRAAPTQRAIQMIVDPDDVDTMVRTLSGECRNEPLIGQIAVAWVIRNRTEDPGLDWWGDTIGQVCRRPYQFSCWLDAEWNASNKAHMIALKATDPEYRHLEHVCQSVLNGTEPDPSMGATHYKVVGTPASWDRAAVGRQTVVIGQHAFYKLGPHG